MNMPSKKPKPKEPAPYKIEVDLYKYYTPVYDAIFGLFGTESGKYRARIYEYEKYSETAGRYSTFSALDAYGNTPAKAIARVKAKQAKARAKERYNKSQKQTVYVTQKEVNKW